MTDECVNLTFSCSFFKLWKFFKNNFHIHINKYNFKNLTSPILITIFIYFFINTKIYIFIIHIEISVYVNINRKFVSIGDEGIVSFLFTLWRVQKLYIKSNKSYVWLLTLSLASVLLMTCFFPYALACKKPYIYIIFDINLKSYYKYKNEIHEQTSIGI